MATLALFIQFPTDSTDFETTMAGEIDEPDDILGLRTLAVIERRSHNSDVAALSSWRLQRGWHHLYTGTDLASRDVHSPASNSAHPS